MHIQTANGRISDASRHNAFAGAGIDYSGGIMPGRGSIPLSGLNVSATYAEIYRSNPWVFAAIRAISLGMSRNRLGVYRPKANGDRECIRFDRPGTDFAGRELDYRLNGPYKRVGPQKRMRLTVVDFLVYGSAIWRDDPGGGYIHTPWRRVNPIINPDREILGMTVISSAPGGTYSMAPEDYLYFSGGDDPDSAFGVSSIAALKYTLQLYEALQRHLVKFFENSARPSGNLQVEKGTDLETREWMREQFRALYTSPENAGKVIITTGEFQPITTSADQSQIIELAKLSREEIAAVYRIPAPVLGILDHAIKSNVTELRQQYTRDAIGSYAPIFEDEIRAQAIDPSPLYDGLFTEWDFTDQLRPDFENLVKSFKEMETTITTDERRAMINFPKLGLPESETVASTPGAEFLGITPAVDPAADGTEPARAENLDGMTIDQANVVGILVRSGYDPESVLAAAGAPSIEHTGLLPVTLKDGKQIEAEAVAAADAASSAPVEPTPQGEVKPPEPGDTQAEDAANKDESKVGA